VFRSLRLTVLRGRTSPTRKFRPSRSSPARNPRVLPWNDAIEAHDAAHDRGELEIELVSVERKEEGWMRRVMKWLGIERSGKSI
jgi:hypothetical protein